MENEKRFFVAIALTLGFLFVWYEYFVPKPIEEPAPNQSAQVATEMGGTQEDTPQAKASQSKSAARQNPQADPTRPSAEDLTQASSPEIAPWSQNITGSKVEYAFTNLAGGISSASLREFGLSADPQSPRIQLFPLGSERSAMYWTFDFGDYTRSDAALRYSLVRSSADEVSFSLAVSPELEVEKTYVIEGEYVVAQTLRLRNIGPRPLNIKSALHMRGELNADLKKGGLFQPAPQDNQAVAFISDDTERWPLGKFAEAEISKGAIEWAGWDRQYFATTALPEKGRWEALALEKTGETMGEVIAHYPRWELPVGETKTFSLKWYVGPKNIEKMEAVHPTLDRSIDLGSWLGVIARPLLKLLRFLYQIVPNYGVAIILLTVVVRLFLFPLTQMQAKSMRKMQSHKPQMDALKEQHGEDREAYSRALMQYMRDHKINPAGGCLLLLPQLPIFFALYRVLYNSIELRHAPFGLWINDLSAHDPFFVLPVLLGVTMFFQQKLTPMPGSDPAQQAMMKFMPLMFTAFMIFLPAGLNIYIFISTLWGVAQQYYIQRGVMQNAK